MKLLERNKQIFSYALYDKTVNGDPVYHPFVQCRGNISRGTGQAVLELFGIDQMYSKLISVEKDCPVDEYSMVKIQDGDYVVRRVVESLNTKTIAVDKVNVSW